MCISFVTRSEAIGVLQGTTSPRCRYLLALCYFRQDKYMDAELSLLAAGGYGDRGATALRTLDNCPEGASGLYLLGQVCARTNRRGDAVQALTQALKLDPFHWGAFVELTKLGWLIVFCRRCVYGS